jgi:hypothetical protein
MRRSAVVDVADDRVNAPVTVARAMCDDGGTALRSTFSHRLRTRRHHPVAHGERGTFLAQRARQPRQRARAAFGASIVHADRAAMNPR